MRIVTIALGFLLSILEVTSFLSRTRSMVETDRSCFQQATEYRPIGYSMAPLPRYNNVVRGPARPTTRLMGVFGLGFGEVAIIAVIFGFILGPEKITEMLRSSGETANEFKQELSKVPDEFQKGMEEGEVEVRARKARRIKVVSRNEDEEDSTQS